MADRGLSTRRDRETSALGALSARGRPIQPRIFRDIVATAPAPQPAGATRDEPPKAAAGAMPSPRGIARVPKSRQDFGEHGRMKQSSDHDRVIDVTQELVKFTWLTRDVSDHLIDRYSEHKESAAALVSRVDLDKAV